MPIGRETISSIYITIHSLVLKYCLTLSSPSILLVDRKLAQFVEIDAIDYAFTARGDVTVKKPVSS